MTLSQDLDTKPEHLTFRHLHEIRLTLSMREMPLAADFLEDDVQDL